MQDEGGGEEVGEDAVVHVCIAGEMFCSIVVVQLETEQLPVY
jgi:hypothetical protein